jgi:hypothetical protein
MHAAYAHMFRVIAAKMPAPVAPRAVAMFLREMQQDK